MPDERPGEPGYRGSTIPDLAEAAGLGLVDDSAHSVDVTSAIVVAQAAAPAMRAASSGTILVQGSERQVASRQPGSACLQLLDRPQHRHLPGAQTVGSCRMLIPSHFQALAATAASDSGSSSRPCSGKAADQPRETSPGAGRMRHDMSELVGSVIQRAAAVRRARIISQPARDYIRSEDEVTRAWRCERPTEAATAAVPVRGYGARWAWRVPRV